jgi:propionyl-CoA carboxylase beta chain
MTDDPGMNELVPDDKAPLDVRKVIKRLVDGGDFLEVQREFAKNLVVGFARIAGIVVGIVANQPMVKAGTLDVDSSDKARASSASATPSTSRSSTLVDVPGFMPGLAQERGGIIRHGAKDAVLLLPQRPCRRSPSSCARPTAAPTSPCAPRTWAPTSYYAWPTAEIAVMGAEGAAFRVLYKKESNPPPTPKPRKPNSLINTARNSPLPTRPPSMA